MQRLARPNLVELVKLGDVDDKHDVHEETRNVRLQVVESRLDALRVRRGEVPLVVRFASRAKVVAANPQSYELPVVVEALLGQLAQLIY